MGALTASHVPFPPHCSRGHVDHHQMAPASPIWLPLPKRGAQEHKNAALYFYCGPVSFSSICLPYVYMRLLGSCTHRPFIMRVAGLTEMKNENSPLLVTRGLNSFKYVIHLVFKLEQTNNPLFLKVPKEFILLLHTWYIFLFWQQKPHGSFSVVTSPSAGMWRFGESHVTSLRPPY